MEPDRTYRLTVRGFSFLFRALGLRLDVQGTEHLPASGGAVVAANHTSYLDFAVVGYVARERGRHVRFLAKRSVFGVPLVGAAMRAMGHVPVDRASGARAYRTARRLAADREVVGLFPESTISRSWRVKPLQRGAAAVARSTDVPLVPVAVWGAHRVATVDGRRSLRRGTPVVVRVGAPLRPRPAETDAELTERLHAAMSGLLDAAMDAYPDQPRDEADRWWLPHDRGGTAPDPETAHELDRAAVARSGDVLP